MKTTHLATALLLAAASGQAQTIGNPWSGVTGDRGNMSAFAFRADAGLYPNSISPAGALDGISAITLTSVTLTRPNDATTPNFGDGLRQITSASATVFLDVYTEFSGGSFSGYLGSSLTGVTWDSTTAGQAYTFDFSAITLAVDQKYWFVFSEDDIDGEISQFRAQLNTSGDDATAGAGKGYLVGDTVQSVTSGGVAQDWAFATSVGFTPVPEPSTLALGFSGAALFLVRLALLRRRNK